MVLSIYLFWSQGLISFATTCAWPGALEFLGILLSSIFITYWCSEITDMVYKSTSVSCWGAELGSHTRASALPTIFPELKSATYEDTVLIILIGTILNYNKKSLWITRGLLITVWKQKSAVNLIIIYSYLSSYTANVVNIYCRLSN